MTKDRETRPGFRVVAPARLHLGFLDLEGGLGRKYGSIGLAIDDPATEIVASRAPEHSASGPEADRVMKIIEKTSRALKLTGHYRIDVTRAIPAHAGLGSGTQLAIAVGAAMMKLEGRALAPAELGDFAGRGARSAIGMAAFEGGGFIVDGGRGTKDLPPPVLIQTPFPEDWRAILVFDPRDQGAHGDRETTAFAALPPFPASGAGELCRLVLMQLVPGLKEHDIDAFGQALTRIQDILGAHFAAAQNGSPWTSPDVGTLIGRLRDAGATGIGQTSWGPTGFAFVSSEAAAARLYHSFVGDARALGLEMTIARGRNSGASVAPL